jgi:transcriptional regulator with XRE-family HTH domain
MADRPVRRCPYGEELKPQQEKYCSNLHRARGEQTIPLDRGEWAVFVEKCICDDLLTQSTFAERVGVSPRAVGNWRRGSAPTDHSLDLVRAVYGDKVPDVVTATELSRDRARANVPLMRAARRSPRARHDQQGRKVPALSAALKARIARAKEEGQPWPPIDTRTNLTAFVGTPRGRARLRLGKRLKMCPTPDRAELNRWARDVADALGVSAEEVMAMWRPVLRDRGLLKAGRRPNNDRHARLAPRVASARLPSGNLPRGFWEEAVRDVNDAEKPTSPTKLAQWRALSSEDLRTWWRRYEKSCTTCTGLTAKVTAKQAVNGGPA